MSRHNVTVHFPNRANYNRLRTLALAWGIPIGATLAKLVDRDIKKRGILFGEKQDLKRRLAK